MRFDGVKRMYGDASDRLASARVMVVGCGGVGSWVVEALARTGIGTLVLVDPDEVCLSNTNRQIQALTETVGRAKIDVLAERAYGIHPGIHIERETVFFNERSAARIFSHPVDYVVDAIDGVMPKAGLIAACVQRNIPVITSGGSGGKRDPGAVRIVDLADTYQDRLLAFVRKKMRHVFGFPAHGPFGVPCVFSPEPAILPVSGCACDRDNPLADEAGGGLNCDGRLGALTFVTGTFGFHAAAHVVTALTSPPSSS